VFELEEYEFRQAENYDGFVDIYINYNSSVLGWIETCRTEEGSDCLTVNLERGVEYRFYNDPNFSILFVFENDSPEDQRLELLYLASFDQALSSLAMSAFATATFAALLM